MEDDPIRNFLSPVADQEAKSSRSESNSVESGITADGSRCWSCEPCRNADTRLEGCTDWTDEKHDLYLDYLETSFVRQLYCLLGGKTHKSFRSHDPPANSYKSTDQFAVQENGCWQKIKLEKKQIHVDASYDFYSRENLSTSGFVHPNIDCYADTAFRRTSMGNPAGKIEYRSCRECSNGSTAESSGQNFKDEDKEDNPSASPVPKRHKRDAEIDSSISYQTFKGCSVQEGKSK